MARITDPDELLKSMKPELVEGKYVFCTVPEKKDEPILTFKEKEGMTLILRKEEADSLNIEYSDAWAMITLTVHSSLEAVGFLAKITKNLAENHKNPLRVSHPNLNVRNLLY